MKTTTLNANELSENELASISGGGLMERLGGPITPIDVVLALATLIAK